MQPALSTSLLLLLLVTDILTLATEPQYVIKNALQSSDEYAAKRLLQGLLLTTAHKVNRNWLQRRLRVREKVLRTAIRRQYDGKSPYHLHIEDDFTLPKPWAHQDNEELNMKAQALAKLMKGFKGQEQPFHPVEDSTNIQNSESDINKLLAQAESLKLNAKELEQQAQVLHHNVGGPSHNMLEGDCSNDQQPEKCLTNDHTKPPLGMLGDIKSPDDPAFPIKPVNSGYPVFDVPSAPGAVITDYQKPLPPAHGVNPYEVLTSSELGGSQYQVNSLQSPSMMAQSAPSESAPPESAPPAAPQKPLKYTVSLKGLRRHGVSKKKRKSKHDRTKKMK